jgi:quercetin dioxygenase-like cupin family protein
MTKKPTGQPPHEQAGKLPTATVMDLAGLVQYADGAIVSRTIAEGPGGTVTLFAFDSGQALSEHSAPFDAIVVVLDGRAELTIGGSPVAASAGQMVVMPAHIPHAVRAPGRFKMLLVMLRA